MPHHATTWSLPAPVAIVEDVFLGRIRGQFAGDPAVLHDHDAVGHADHLGELTGDHEYGDALCSQAAHDLVDGVLGADVDAAGGLVHQDDAGAGGEPAGEHDLLLVAAGEELRLLGQSSAPRRRAWTGRPGTAGGPRRCGREDRADDAEGVVEDRLVQGQAGRLAVLGDQREPATDRLARSAYGDVRAVEESSPRVNGVTPKIASSSSVRPEPWSPATPTISPPRRVRSMPST